MKTGGFVRKSQPILQIRAKTLCVVSMERKYAIRRKAPQSASFHPYHGRVLALRGVGIAASACPGICQGLMKVYLHLIGASALTPRQ